MNSPLIMADRTTHLKILIVSLLASILLLWVGISARATAATGVSKSPHIERSMEWNRELNGRDAQHLHQNDRAGYGGAVARSVETRAARSVLASA